MATFRVLLTDYAWPDVEIERAVLAEYDAELVVASAGDVETLTELARDVDAIMTNWAKVPAAVIDAAPDCRIIARLGIGLDNIDVRHATARGIPVTNVPDYCLTEVAEHTIALLLALARKIHVFSAGARRGEYDLSAGFPLRRIEGQTLGIVGLGQIGRRVAEKARALGLDVIATSRSQGATGSASADLDKTLAKPVAPTRITPTPLEELFSRSDFVSLHVPLTDETRHLIGDAQLAQMKPTAFLINTARGALVDHAALATALADDRLAGAALDVQEPEPPDLTQPPWNDPRVIVTPHAAFYSSESVADLRDRVAHQVGICLTGGRPENVVNADVLRQ